MHVTCEYVLKDDAGEILDDSRATGAPMELVHGYGMVVPGLEAALAGLAVGDERVVLVPPEAGFGDHDEELVMEIDREELPSPDLAPGDEMIAAGPDGEEVVLRLVELLPDGAVVDGNHPLAGLTLTYEIAVTGVRPATDDEIADAAQGFEEAGYEGSIPPDPAAPSLVQLRRKPS